MIKVIVPAGYLSAKKYVFDFIFSIFELKYELVVKERENYLIEFDNSNSIEIKDNFFDCWDGEINANLVPTDVLYSKDIFAKSGAIPIIFGSPNTKFKSKNCFIEFDLIGSIFFFLSRIEEYIYEERDKHGRVLASNSFLYKNDLLNRPVVDEYIYYLKKLSSKYGAISFKDRIGEINVTCDVDWPFDPNLKSIKHLVRTCGVEIFRNKNLKSPISLVINYLKSKVGLKVLDENRASIDWIMDVNEQKGHKVTFYFIPKPTSLLDNPEPLNTKKNCSLLKEILNRGHMIGVHPGYECINSKVTFKHSINDFKNVLSYLSANVRQIKSRMHFLRWDNMETPRLLDELNITDDSTMGYAECAGFRCGTAHSHFMFDIYDLRVLNVIQTPLIVMESSVIAARYEGMGYTEKAFQRINHLKSEAHKYGGIFTILWHNCHLISEQDKNLYLRCI